MIASQSRKQVRLTNKLNLQVIRSFLLHFFHLKWVDVIRVSAAFPLAHCLSLFRMTVYC